MSSGVQPAQSFTPYFHQHYRRQSRWLDWPGNIPTTNTVFYPPQHIGYFKLNLHCCKVFVLTERRIRPEAMSGYLLFLEIFSFIIRTIIIIISYSFVVIGRHRDPFKSTGQVSWNEHYYSLSGWLAWCGVVRPCGHCLYCVNQIVSQILWKGNLLLSITLTQLWRPNVGFLQSHPNPSRTKSDKYWNIQSWLPVLATTTQIPRDNCSYIDSIIFQFYQMSQAVWVNQ